MNLPVLWLCSLLQRTECEGFILSTEDSQGHTKYGVRSNEMIYSPVFISGVYVHPYYAVAQLMYLYSVRAITGTQYIGQSSIHSKRAIAHCLQIALALYNHVQKAKYLLRLALLVLCKCASEEVSGIGFRSSGLERTRTILHDNSTSIAWQYGGSRLCSLGQNHND